VYVVTAGSSLTSGQNFAALYDSSKNLVGITADQATAWGTTGEKVMALTTPYVVTAPGLFKGAMWSVGTTPPAFARTAVGD
jgi:hypothetical protein